MKKKFTALLLLTAFITSCNTAYDTQTETTTTATETTTTTAKITTTSAKTTADEPEISPADFKLADYCREFDEAKPVPYTALTEPSATYDEKKRDMALDLLVNSDYYKDVSEYAKETFTYENGEFLYSGESWYDKGFGYYLEYSETEGVVVAPCLDAAYDISTDGTGSEYIFIYSIPLPRTAEMEWSGTAAFFTAIYVNYKNEAVFLTDVCYQTLNNVTPLFYSDGVVHVLFNRGHSMGTKRSHIYSFENGEAKLLIDGYLFMHKENSPFLEVNVRLSGESPVFLFFRDEITDKYCGVSAEPASKELIDALCASEQVLKNIPEFKNWCTRNSVFTLGGKYIIVCDPDGRFDINVHDVFTLENGVFTSYGKAFYPTYELCETNVSIDLSKYE